MNQNYIIWTTSIDLPQFFNDLISGNKISFPFHFYCQFSPTKRTNKTKITFFFRYLEYSRSKYKEPVPLMGRSAILGEQRNNYFCDVACGRGEMGDSTYAITKVSDQILWQILPDGSSGICTKTGHSQSPAFSASSTIDGFSTNGSN